MEAVFWLVWCAAWYTGSHQLFKACLNMPNIVEVDRDEVTFWERIYLDTLGKKFNS